MTDYPDDKPAFSSDEEKKTGNSKPESHQKTSKNAPRTEHKAQTNKSPHQNYNHARFFLP